MARPKTRNGLTEQQEKFVQHYVKNGNASAAYRHAYNSKGMLPKTVTEAASRMLRKSNVAARLQQLQEKTAARNDVTADMIVQELRKVGFADIRRAVKWNGTSIPLKLGKGDEQAGTPGAVELISSDAIDDDTAAAISEVSQTTSGIKIKFHDKLSALEKLGRNLGMFKDITELTGKNGAPIEVRDSKRDLARWLALKLIEGAEPQQPEDDA